MKDSRDSSIIYYPYYMERINKSIEKSVSATTIDVADEVSEKYIEMLHHIQIAFSIRYNPFISDKDFLSKCCFAH